MFLNRLSKKSDEELMLLIQQGEERALTELYNRYSKPMVRYFYRMLWDDADKAQDFLHDLFLKIIERPRYFDTKRKFSTWIYSIAHNMCKNEYRKKRFRDEAKISLTKPELAENTIHEDLDWKEFNRVLNIAKAQWSEEDRSLFTFRHELEMTFGEIGEVLNCPEGTVKSRWFYLRKSMAEQFQGFQSVLK
jgi:RNA polymerase sigma-70 factor (ECF subfamily)